ncbi:MAG: PAS domain S-box protein [Candidatus Altiarchaeota archaeon]
MPKKADLGADANGVIFPILLEKANDAIAIIQGEKFRFVNNKIASILGYTKKELIDTDFSKVLDLESKKIVNTRYMSRLKGEEVPETYEIKWSGKNGKFGYADISPTVFDYKGKKAILLIARDTTQKKYAIEALKKSTEEYETILKNTRDIIYTTDPKGVITYVSPQVSSIFEFEPVEVIGRPIFEFVHPNDISEVMADFQKTIIGGAEFPIRFRIIGKTGNHVFVENLGKAIKCDNKVVGVTGVIRDVTPQEKAERQKDETEYKYQTLLQNIRDGVYTLDPNGLFTYVNDVIVRRSGHSKNWFRKKSFFDFVRKEFRDAAKENFDAIMQGDTQPPFQAAYDTADGNILWIEINTKSLLSDGKIHGLIGVSRNITERKKAEESLSESEANFRALATNAKDGIVILIGKGVITYANKEASKISGYRLEELINKRIADIFHPDEMEIVTANYEKRIEGKSVPSAYESRIIRKDGKTLAVEVSDAKTIWHGGPADLIIVRDISERKKAEEKLKKEIQFSNTLVQASPTFFVAVDKDGKTLMMNKAMLNALGYSPFEVVGSDYLSTFVAEHDRELVNKIFEDRRKSRVPTLHESTVLKKNGEKLLLEWHGTQVRKANGELEFTFGVGIDITERRKQEEEIQALNEYNQNLIRDSPVGIFTTDKEGFVTSANLSLIEILGSPGEEKTKQFNILEMESIKKAGVQELFLRVLMQGEKIAVRSIPYQSYWGKKTTISIRSGPLYDSEKKISGLLGIVEDLSEKRRLEEKITRFEKKRIPLTLKEQKVFYSLSLNPTFNDRELSEVIGIERSTITAVRNRLLSRGFYTRINAPSFRQIGCSTLSIIQARYRSDTTYEEREKTVSQEILEESPGLFFSYITDREEFMAICSSNQKEFDETFSRINEVLKEKGFYEEQPNISHFSLDHPDTRFEYDASRLIGQVLGVKKQGSPAPPGMGRKKLTNKERIIFQTMIDFPRFNNTQIASKINVSRRKVSQSKKKLFDNDLMTSLVIPDMGFLGIEILVFCQFSFNQNLAEGKVNESVATLLENLPFFSKINNKSDFIGLMGFSDYTSYKSAFEKVFSKLMAERVVLGEPKVIVFPIEGIKYYKLDFSHLVRKKLNEHHIS